MNRSQFALIAVSLVFASQAFGAREGEGRGSLAALRQAIRVNDVKVTGPVSCKVAAQNNGEACALTIEDRGSGKTFKLEDGGEVMKLFHSGTRHVSVEGTLTEFDTIRVGKAAQAYGL